MQSNQLHTIGGLTEQTNTAWVKLVELVTRLQTELLGTKFYIEFKCNWKILLWLLRKILKTPQLQTLIISVQVALIRSEQTLLRRYIFCQYSQRNCAVWLHPSLRCVTYDIEHSSTKRLPNYVLQKSF
jgi:hypothetical protein